MIVCCCPYNPWEPRPHQAGSGARLLKLHLQAPTQRLYQHHARPMVRSRSLSTKILLLQEMFKAAVEVARSVWEAVSAALRQSWALTASSEQKEHAVALNSSIVPLPFSYCLILSLIHVSYCPSCVHCPHRVALFLSSLIIRTSSILSLFDHSLPCFSSDDSRFLATTRKSICWPDRIISSYECFSDFGLRNCKS